MVEQLTPLENVMDASERKDVLKDLARALKKQGTGLGRLILPTYYSTQTDSFICCFYLYFGFFFYVFLLFF